MNAAGIVGALALVGMCLGPAPGLAQTADGKRQLAQQLMDETGMTANLDSMTKSMIEQMVAHTTAEMSPETRARAGQMAEAMSAALQRVTPRIMAVSIDAYAQTFTEEELQGILAFYRTPVGRSMAAKMPVLMRNVTDASLAIMPEMQAAMAAELCARQTCPDRLKALAEKAPKP
ncbi:MAG: DUF2059 domain-containing protein [Phenylobacterium sp.]|uniref:DUF2059 domain-containing protein n=1 Tax=Phenylobacterium sp. TaxID=1871053 RepID=UPI001A594642|nr:DUF2059 domain-containing protein [Phenylobacterium sp.]MBL8770218.1 DUF2059 domain-containing protein [Phenylobacterium sp.]